MYKGGMDYKYNINLREDDEAESFLGRHLGTNRGNKR
jgi:hypothetical protein